jgi:hypothetical protein
MGVRQTSKHEVVAALHDRYWAASRREKGRLVDELVALTGYHRKYATTLLRHGPPVARATRRGGRPPVYGPAVLAALQVAAEATGWICGKRLAPFLSELVPALEREGALTLTPSVRAALLSMSAATIDRRLAPVRAQAKPRGHSTTKPGSLLKQQVPVRTDTPWDDQRPGFVEIDLVAHCGTTTEGHYVCTLDVVDVATGWTECAAISHKNQETVFAALTQVADRLPFPLLGIDSDNGSEFLNGHLIRYCQHQQLTFTRCRAYHKNDQAHVEQKNWSVVRQLVGYDRYEGETARRQLERVYGLARLYVNGYLPVMKLIGKERVGAKVRKHYDTPQTPYRRAVTAGVLRPQAQAAFAAQLATIGPLTLRRQLEAELERLWRLRVGSSALAAVS